MKRILFHLLFWIILAVMYSITYSRLDSENSWILILKDLFAVMTIFYSTGYFIIPKWFANGKYLLCGLWIIVIYSWWGIVTNLSVQYINLFLSPNPRLKLYVEAALKNGIIGLFNPSILPFYLLDFIYLVSLPLGVKMTQVLVNERNEKTQLQLRNAQLALNNANLTINNLKLELDFLKNQINPHFLFNTLNNILILVTENSPNGADSIVKLCNIMNYLLHDSNDNVLPLDNEFSFLKDYIDLEKLRFNESIRINTHIETDSELYKIVPLIILPFIENAFKHGPKSSRKNMWVDIFLDVKDGQLQLEVSNAYIFRLKPIDYKGGIGLENVKKRLALYYGDSYILNIENDEGTYKVNLYLDLNYSVDGLLKKKGEMKLM